MTMSSQDSTSSSVMTVARPQRTGQKALKAATRVERHAVKHSRYYASENEVAIPRFHPSELVLGKLLGSGGFNSVYEVTHIDLQEQEKPDSEHTASTVDTSTDDQSRLATASQGCQYAVKFLNPKTRADPDRYCIGAADLVLESKFLSNLHHPNIIKLRGLPTNGLEDIASVEELSVFLLLDKLHYTLIKRMQDWHRYQDELQNARKMWMLGPSRKKLNAFSAERVQVALDIANALEYLHEHRIIYRDLKPENVGFCEQNTTVLFDFGLAKELKVGPYDETYHLTGHTGSLRYMSPEVARYLPYNLSADSYSFGILLWHIYALQLPYEDMSRSAHSHLVVYGGQRPPLDEKSWPPVLVRLMKACWEEAPYKRPKMSEICGILKTHVQELGGVPSAGEPMRKSRSGSFVLNRDHIAEQPPQRSRSLVTKVIQRLPSNRPIVA